MTSQTARHISGQPPSETEQGNVGTPQFQRTPGKAEGEDPDSPEGKPQGTQQDQEGNMDSEGHLVQPPATEAG